MTDKQEPQEPSEFIQRLRRILASSKLPPPPRNQDSLEKLCFEIATDESTTYDVVKEASRLARLQHLSNRRETRHEERD